MNHHGKGKGEAETEVAKDEWQDRMRQQLIQRLRRKACGTTSKWASNCTSTPRYRSSSAHEKPAQGLTAQEEPAQELTVPEVTYCCNSIDEAATLKEELELDDAQIFVIHRT